MIVKAVGITSEQVWPRGAGATTARAAASEWLVATSDRRLRSELAAAIGRRGGIVRDSGVLDEWRRRPPAGRRYAFVDLVAAVDGPTTGFVEQLTRPGVAPRPLLIVRGADGDTAGELLARRAGAVAYLAGELRPGFCDSLVAEVTR